MRILHVSESAGGGVLGVLRTLAAGHVARGHDVAVAWGQRPETPADVAAVLPPGVTAIRLPWGARTPATQLRAARALRRAATDFGPDVVHLHSSFAGAVGGAVLGGRWPIVYSPHAYAFARAHEAPWRRRAYRAAERALSRRCDVVGAVSAAEGEDARSIGAPRVVVVPNGIPELDPGALPAPGNRSRPRVVGLGRLTPQRPPDDVAWILSRVPPAAEVRWIGGAPDGEDAPLRAAGVPVTGWLAHEDALAALGDATVYLHWSAWDGQPLAILEAFARDVVVVASDIPANRELVGPGQVAADREGALALVRRILADDGFRAELLAAQRARRGRWSAERMVAGWLDAYRGVLARPRSADAKAGLRRHRVAVRDRLPG